MHVTSIYTCEAGIRSLKQAPSLYLLHDHLYVVPVESHQRNCDDFYTWIQGSG